MMKSPVYGGAHLFVADISRKLGEAALRALADYAPGAAALDAAVETDLLLRVYDRVVEKLRREPVEDYRIDFEDGYGNRPDSEEDGHAAAAARAVARSVVISTPA